MLPEPVPAPLSGAEAKPDYRFGRDRRLRKRSEFGAVYSKGRSWSHPLLALRVLPNQLPITRFGFAIGKKVGGAVVRNLVKRRLREAVRQTSTVPGFDIVIIGRPPARECSYQELRAALLDLMKRGRLLAPHPPLPPEGEDKGET